jgi:hypothetical protein
MNDVAADHDDLHQEHNHKPKDIQSLSDNDTNHHLVLDKISDSNNNANSQLLNNTNLIVNDCQEIPFISIKDRNSQENIKQEQNSLVITDINNSDQKSLDNFLNNISEISNIEVQSEIKTEENEMTLNIEQTEKLIVEQDKTEIN